MAGVSSRDPGDPVDLPLQARPRKPTTLEAQGTTGGNLDDVWRADTIIAGTGMVEVDAYGTTLFGMQPADLEYLVNAANQGLGTIDLGALDILEGEA